MDRQNAFSHEWFLKKTGQSQLGNGLLNNFSIPDSPVSSAVASAVVLAAAFQLSAASLSFSAALVAAAGVATEPAVAAVVTHLSSFVPLSASVAQSAAVDVPVYGELPAVLVFFSGLPPVSFLLLLAVS